MRPVKPPPDVETAHYQGMAGPDYDQLRLIVSVTRERYKGFYSGSKSY